MHEKMDNFTAESLQNFIRTPPARNRFLDEEMDLNAGNPDKKSQIPGGKPRTARAERIGQILQNVSGRPDQPRSDSQATGPRHHDAQIRQHMGEMVRTMLQEGRGEDLAVILESHQQFISEVLTLIRQSRG